MEPESLKQIGKLLFQHAEVVLTSPYTIVGRTSNFQPSKDLKGNDFSLNPKDFLQKNNFKAEDIRKQELGDNLTISKNSALFVLHENSRYFGLFLFLKNSRGI